MIELCRHIKPEGTACKGPAVRGTNFCRHHQLIRKTLDKVKPSIENNGVYQPLPFLFPEARSAIQTNVFLVINAFNRRRIDAKAASVMIYGLQVCLSNLNKGPLAQADAENAVQRVILTPEGDEIAPPREKLEQDESPIHYKDCPCQRCAEQFRGAAPEQHHADCKCGLCEPRAQGSEHRAQESVTADEVSGVAAGGGKKPEVRAASAHAFRSADTLDPIQKEPNYHHYIYGDEIAKHEAQHAARVRAALEAGLEPTRTQALGHVYKSSRARAQT